MSAIWNQRFLLETNPLFHSCEIVTVKKILDYISHMTLKITIFLLIFPPEVSLLLTNIDKNIYFLRNKLVHNI